MINSYYLLINGEKAGPHTQYEIMDMNINVRTMVLSPLADDWQEMLDLPEFAQHLEDRGIYIPTKANYATFWWRLLAYLIDYVIIIVIGVVAVAALYIVKAFIFRVDTDDPPGEGFNNLLLFTIMLLYHAGFEATELRGGIGKMICKLCVVDVHGKRLRFGKALSRNVAKLLSSLVLGLGFLNVLWDSRRQGWHDQLAKTYVIRRK